MTASPTQERREPPATPGVVSRVLIPVALSLISALYLLPYIRTGWIPHDEGTIAQPAERVLLGELPHRDFIDMYTGGLTFLHAAAFRLFEPSLLVPRLILLAVTLVWIPAVYAIARRFVRPVAAAGVALLALVWSVPNYFAALPSWYNLFFATFFLAALIHYVETERRRYLLIAGVFAGLSMIMKIVGIYLIAAGLLFLAYRAAEAHAAPATADATGSAPGPGYRRNEGRLWFSVGLTACLVLFLAVLLLTLGRHTDATYLYHFFVPGAAAAIVIGTIEWTRSADGAFRARLSGLVGDALWLLAGAAMPVLIFTLPFLLTGSLADVWRGVFVIPARRLTDTVVSPPSLAVGMVGLAVFMLVLRGVDRIHSAVAAALAALLLLAPFVVTTFPQMVIVAAQSSVSVIVVAGCVLLLRRLRDDVVAKEVRDKAAAALFVLALCTLIQFPYAYVIYFLYVAPLVVIAGAAVHALWHGPPRRAPAGLLVTILIFAALWVNHASPVATGLHYRPGTNTAVIALPRAGGLRASPRDSATYTELVARIGEHTMTNSIYAGPDAPEVYFLSGTRNPTPHLFEFFEDEDARDARLLQAIDSLGINVAVINLWPDFTPRVGPTMMRELEKRMPMTDTIGRFLLLWRDAGPP
jgi:hypothetical protein